MIPVVIESPYAGDVPLHLRYLRACMRDAVLRGESPYASHGFLTQPGVLRDELPEEPELGISAGFVWRELAKLTVFYEDLGWSNGMYRALHDCSARALPFERRTLGPHWLGRHIAREREAHALEHWIRSLQEAA